MDEQNVELQLKKVMAHEQFLLDTKGDSLTDERKEWIKGTIAGLRYALHFVEKYNKQS